jgi:N-acetylglucosaminyl-diphospho-decaprenol L-rhamnosyltransferase
MGSRHVDIAIIIPVYNQSQHTAVCLATLGEAGFPLSSVVVVDNASTDDTPACLARAPGIQIIRNETNRGCGGAWNQGVRAASATWTVLLNNDVVIPRGWLEGMLAFADEEKADVVSPAACEGEQDYGVHDYARQFVQKMAAAKRINAGLGFCFMVHRRVFERAGLFDDDLRLGGYEDDEFFRRARRAGFRLGITGRSFLHHIGSATQLALKVDNKGAKASLGDRAYYRRKYGLTWFKRQQLRWGEKISAARWRRSELSRYGATLLARRQNGEFIWR